LIGSHSKSCPMASDSEVLKFYQANIHEKRPAAFFFRILPLGLFIVFLALLGLGIFRYLDLLLVICAVLNISIWLFMVAMAMFGIMGARTAAARLQEGVCSEIDSSNQRMEGQDPVTHCVVIANYQEDEEILAQTVRALAEAEGSDHIRVVLAMEEREGAKAKEKAKNLKERFGKHFQSFMASYHPTDLVVEHLDGTQNNEVKGKASNVRWGVAKAYEDIQNDASRDPENCVLTVLDADCIFHPQYFAHVTQEFCTMRETAGEQHQWTMWQAPQLPYRNYYQSPIPSRVWGYISSVYEFGGVSSLLNGGHHMVFSAYSVSLKLAVNADLWDGDIIAEDHHAYLKCFFYSTYVSAKEELEKLKNGEPSEGCKPRLRVRPVMLPVKSTSVQSSEGYWASWKERWEQAKRHCQGVAEMCYAMLATWDIVCSIPWRLYNVQFLSLLLRANFRMIVMHFIPLTQSLALGLLTLYWLFHHRRVPRCPEKIAFATAESDMLLCGLAGAWALTWPVLIPFFLIAASNFLMIVYVFVRPGLSPALAPVKLTQWHKEDGGVPPTWGHRSLTVCWLVLVDCIIWVGPVMAVYGILPELLAYWNVALRGNSFEYITAAKLVEKQDPVSSYGTMDSSKEHSKTAIH